MPHLPDGFRASRCRASLLLSYGVFQLSFPSITRVSAVAKQTFLSTIFIHSFGEAEVPVGRKTCHRVLVFSYNVQNSHYRIVAGV